MTVAPKKALGQHFLVDENILGVIGRLAELDADRRRARGRPGSRCPHPLPRRSRARGPCRRARPLARAGSPRPLGERSNVHLVWADALDLDVADSPPCTHEARRQSPLQHCDAARRRVTRARRVAPALVRHGAARGRRQVLRAAAHQGVRRGLGSRPARARERRGFHPVPPTVFRPRPRVDSALVAFERVRGRARSPTVRPVVEAAFAHRRKTLANSVALAGLAAASPRRGSAARVDRHRPASEPRSSSRRSSSRSLSTSDEAARSAYAKINLGLVVGSLRDDGKHEVVTVLQRVDLHDDVALERRGRSSRSRGSRRTRSSGARWSRSPSAAGSSRAGTSGSRSGSRSPPGLGGGSSDAAAALQLANADCPDPLRPNALHAIAAAVGADVPFFLRQGAQVATGDGTELTGVDLPIDYHVVAGRAAGREETVHRCGLRRVRRTRRRSRVRAARSSIPSRARVDLGRAPTSPGFRRTISPRRRSRASSTPRGRFALTSRVPAPPSTASSSSGRSRCGRRRGS